jgi:hypothetical protein
VRGDYFGPPGWLFSGLHQDLPLRGTRGRKTGPHVLGSLRNKHGNEVMKKVEEEEEEYDPVVGCPACGVGEHKQCPFWYFGCCCHNGGPQPFGDCPPGGCSCGPRKS